MSDLENQIKEVEQDNVRLAAKAVLGQVRELVKTLPTSTINKLAQAQIKVESVTRDLDAARMERNKEVRKLSFEIPF